jgi:phosphate/sulfate permease
MAGKKRVRSEFIFAVIFIALVAFALLADWWKTHAAIGWTIVALLILALIFAIIRFSSFRHQVNNTIKNVGEKIIYEDEASEREPVPDKVRKEIYNRANYCCENPDCRHKTTIHIHHIDMNHSNNDFNNLIALCPTCHDKAHKGIFTTTQLRNWLRADFHQLKQRRYNTKSNDYRRY